MGTEDWGQRTGNRGLGTENWEQVLIYRHQVK